MIISREEYIKAIESAFLGMLKKAAVKYIVSKLPFFALPALNPLLGFVVGIIVDKAAQQAELGIYFAYTDLRTSIQARSYSEAAITFNQNRTPENEKIMLDKFYALVSLRQ